jgi:hypothetical protein
MGAGDVLANLDVFTQERHWITMIYLWTADRRGGECERPVPGSLDSLVAS